MGRGVTYCPTFRMLLSQRLDVELGIYGFFYRVILSGSKLLNKPVTEKCYF